MKKEIPKLDVVFIAYSKRNFYKRARISLWAWKKGFVPINPFLNFDYFLMDNLNSVETQMMNIELIRRADALWVVDEISDGVEEEIEIARQLYKPIHYYKERKDGWEPIGYEDKVTYNVLEGELVYEC